MFRFPHCAWWRAEPPWSGRIAALGVLASCCLIPACAPTFSELQSARLAGPGRVEVTPSYSSTFFSGDGETEKAQDHFGVQLATGVSENVDLRVRYEYIKIEDDGIHVVGLGPKFSLARDRAAFYIPVGTAIEEDIQSGDLFSFHPTFLYTQPFSPSFELTASGKAILWVDRDIDDYLGFNLGAGISSDLTKWAIRPEGGILINPGEEGSFWHVSVGFTYYADRER
jgi:hypothetical protein